MASLENNFFEDIISAIPPVVVIDLSGIIRWSNRNNIKPNLPVNAYILDIIPAITLEDLFIEENNINVSVDGISYCINTYPLKNEQKVTLIFEDTNSLSYLKEQIYSMIQENQLLNGIIESPYQGIIYVDLDGVVQFVNNAFANYVGLRKHELIGHKLENFKCSDSDLLRILESQKPDLLTFYPKPRKLIASRTPVFRNGKIVGACARYISVDPQDVKNNFFDDEYIDIISRLQTRDIMFNVSKAMIELNSYKDEFQKTNTTRSGIDNIIGNSYIIQELKEKVLMVSNSPSSVLITGESGTGKELFAQAIHFHGNRCSFPFVKINCAAIPENLLESELFGYVEGAFTGAKRGGKLGKFELANKGTIFLDEIGDMPLSMQTKLLRTLQEREIERIGGQTTIPIDVRVISATNKNLNLLVKNGTFREDLYYRLNVVNFHIPPLRDRMMDLPDIANTIVANLNLKLNRTIADIPSSVLDLLLNYDWPGNIRELMNVLEASMNFCRSSVLQPKDLPHFLHSNRNLNNNFSNTLKAKYDNIEREQIYSVLEQCKGNRKAAASVLGVSKSTLYRIMKKHDLL